ncbi:MAG: D-ribose transporter ATP-binding protein [Anaerolineae bacterium SG8_19]|jgi:rhamnose transport system ATP-binding protein|nr:MAG: D-ribose transporter ATP-binding protein [Anaerolineae bacterium SG8_19]
MTDNLPVLTTHGIYMAFGGVNVLKDIDFEIYPGEIHGLVGENGAGKSTLLKNIAGVHVPKAGEIRLNGKVVQVPNPHAATDLQIALIHQEPLTFPDLDVAENIFIGRQPMSSGLSRLDWATMYSRSAEILNSLGVKLDPRAKVRGLSIADQQMVEMAGALSQDAKILLMDEPTAALTPSEVKDLFAIMRLLRDRGTAIVFISHRLEEVFEICDRITVLRDGELIDQRMVGEVSVDEIIQMMVGRPLSTLFEKGDTEEFGEPVLEVEGLMRTLKFENITFNIRAGEIVGMAGLIGAGRTDVARALFGTLEIDSGTIRIDGQRVEIGRPRDALKHGIIYVPEDRKQNGLLMPMSVIKNMTLAVLERLSRNGWLRESLEEEAAQEYVKKLNIVLRDPSQPVRELSGGNQQKVVLSRWLMTKPKVMLLDEPTRGIDIGAKAEVHRLMSELAAQGIAILMISSELPEILAMSDRIIVMREGRISGRFDKDEATAESVIAAAAGQFLQEG